MDGLGLYRNSMFNPLTQIFSSTTLEGSGLQFDSMILTQQMSSPVGINMQYDRGEADGCPSTGLASRDRHLPQSATDRQTEGRAGMQPGLLIRWRKELQASTHRLSVSLDVPGQKLIPFGSHYMEVCRAARPLPSSLSHTSRIHERASSSVFRLRHSSKQLLLELTTRDRALWPELSS